MSKYGRCTEYRCKQEAEISCCLCEAYVCAAHAHFVDDQGDWKRFVCDTCYQVCMTAYENKQQETVL